MRKINIAIMFEGLGTTGAGGVVISSLYLIKRFNPKKFNFFCVYYEEGIFSIDIVSNNIIPIKLNLSLPLPVNAEPKIPFYLKIYRRIKQMYFILFSAFKLIFIIRHNKIDVIHTMHFTNYASASIASHITGIKHIRTQPNFINTKEKLNAKTFKWTPFAKWTDFFITYQFYARDDLLKLGVPINKIYVQKNRFNIRKNIETPITSDIRKEFGWDADVKIVCSMSRLVREKGLETFVKMIPHIIKEYTNVKFLILGEGPIKEKLIARCLELGVYDYVFFPGFRIDKENIAKQVTLGVYPTSDTVGMIDIPIYGNVLISKYSEAMEEFIVDRKTGYLIKGDDPIDYASAVIKLLKDDILRDEMQNNIVTYYSDFEQGYFKNSIGIKEFENIIIKLVNDNQKRS